MNVTYRETSRRYSEACSHVGTYTRKAGVCYLPVPSSCWCGPWHHGWASTRLPWRYRGAQFGARAGARRQAGCRGAWEEEERQPLAVRVMLSPLTLGSENSIWPRLSQQSVSCVWEGTPEASCVTLSAPFAIVQYIRCLCCVFFF